MGFSLQMLPTQTQWYNCIAEAAVAIGVGHTPQFLQCARGMCSLWEGVAPGTTGVHLAGYGVAHFGQLVARGGDGIGA
jgi:hypothetical protein